MSIESAFKSAGLKFTYGTELKEHRCKKCNRMLGKFNGQAEIKCPKCGEVNRIGEGKDE